MTQRVVIRFVLHIDPLIRANKLSFRIQLAVMQSQRLRLSMRANIR